MFSILRGTAFDEKSQQNCGLYGGIYLVICLIMCLKRLKVFVSVA